MLVSNSAEMQLKKPRKLRKRLGIATGLLAVCYAGAYAFFAHAMRQTPDEFSQLMARVSPVPFLVFPFESMWLQARAGALHPDDSAPDFKLPLLDHSGEVSLSSFRGVKPVVLIFGSYT